jgi:hypothetical protein
MRKTRKLAGINANANIIQIAVNNSNAARVRKSLSICIELSGNG